MWTAFVTFGNDSKKKRGVANLFLRFNAHVTEEISVFTNSTIMSVEKSHVHKSFHNQTKKDS